VDFGYHAIGLLFVSFTQRSAITDAAYRSTA